MKKIVFGLLLGWQGLVWAQSDSVIAFGSCIKEWQDQPVWRAVQKLAPSHFIFMGDNVYADNTRYLLNTRSARFAEAYETLADNPDYQNFVQDLKLRQGKVLATWDDHDYGENDGGADYSGKMVAKSAFAEFFKLPGLPADPEKPGVYSAAHEKLGDLDVNIILLDTRSFRGPMKREPDPEHCEAGGKHIVPEGATILGDEQWQWFADELREPADLRLVVSSIQLLPFEHCFEKWQNFAWERQRFIDTVAQSGAEGVLILSGDRHLSEISILKNSAIGYPLYEVTSSGLNSAIGPKPVLEPNSLRAFSKPVTQDSFGTISLSTESDELALQLSLHAVDGSVLQTLQVPISQLQRSKSSQ